MKCPVKLLVLVTLLPVAGQADDLSAGDPAIGRIFMTQAERDELDRLRQLPPPAERAGPARSSEAAPESEPEREGSGYILRSRGAAWLWADGDFRSVRPTDIDRGRQLPEISITRHPGAAADAESDDEESAGKDDADGN